MNRCKDCDFWHNLQRELEYDKNYGFCDQPIYFEGNFSTENEKYKIYVHEPFGNVNAEFINAEGTLKDYKYCFVACKDFGCIFFKKRK